MAKCKYCKGNGTYMVREVYGDGDEALMAYECNHCNGTGEEDNINDNGDFSIGDDDDDD